MKKIFIKRVFAVIGIVMCLACSMMPVAFADTVMSARSDVRIAGFDEGLSTLRSSPITSANFYGGVVVFDGVDIKSATVADLRWLDDDSESGYFTVLYDIQIEPIDVSEYVDKPIIGIPLDWGDANVRYELQYYPIMHGSMESATELMHMHSLKDYGGSYYVDGTGETMMVFYGGSDYLDGTEVVDHIQVVFRIWDPTTQFVTANLPPVGSSFGERLTYPFQLVNAGSGVIMAFFRAFMNTALLAPIIGITGSALLMAIIISIVR